MNKIETKSHFSLATNSTPPPPENDTHTHTHRKREREASSRLLGAVLFFSLCDPGGPAGTREPLSARGAAMETRSGRRSAGTEEPQLIRHRQTLHHPGDSHASTLTLSFPHTHTHTHTHRAQSPKHVCSHANEAFELSSEPLPRPLSSTADCHFGGGS